MHVRQIPAVAARTHDRDGVPGALEELALQTHRDLRAAGRLDVLVAEHHDVQPSSHAGSVSPRYSASNVSSVRVMSWTATSRSDARCICS